MFCDRCGKNNPDGMDFCEECGNPLRDGVVAGTGDSSKTVKIIASVIVCLVAVGLLVWGIIGIVGCVQTGASSKPIKEYYNAINKDEYNKLFSELPKEFKDLLNDSKKQTIKEQLKAQKKSDKKDFGSGYKISYRVVDYIDYSDDEVEDIEDEWNKKLVNDSVEIDDAREYQIRVTKKGKKKKEETFTTDTVLKIDGKWYSETVLDTIVSDGYTAVPEGGYEGETYEEDTYEVDEESYE